MTVAADDGPAEIPVFIPIFHGYSRFAANKRPSLYHHIAGLVVIVVRAGLNEQLMEYLLFFPPKAVTDAVDGYFDLIAAIGGFVQSLCRAGKDRTIFIVGKDFFPAVLYHKFIGVEIVDKVGAGGDGIITKPAYFVVFAFVAAVTGVGDGNDALAV
jgi:hypothetical protein